jgi:hypothetical protein
MNKPKPQKYHTTNWSNYNAALKSRGSLDVWFDPNMSWFATPNGKIGRCQTFSDGAIQTCLMLKSLFQLALRQTTGFVESLFRLGGLTWAVPDFSTLSRRQKHIDIDIPYQASQGGLHLLIDSTGIKMIGEGEWKRKKHGAEYRRQWRKLHIGIDAETLQIRAVMVTDSRTGDAPVLPDLLNQIPANESLLTVGGDGAYDTKQCHHAIAARGAAPVIPTRRNGQPWKEKSVGATARNETLALTRLLGRRVWRNWSGYHRRSLVEGKMRCVKLLGEKLMSRDFDRQVNELHARIAVLNHFTMLGRPCTQVVS